MAAAIADAKFLNGPVELWRHRIDITECHQPLAEFRSVRGDDGQIIMIGEGNLRIKALKPIHQGLRFARLNLVAHDSRQIWFRDERYFSRVSGYDGKMQCIK